MDAVPSDPTAITPERAAELLSRESGVTITAAVIRKDLSAGAPTNSDGTLNLVHYAAWLVAQERGLSR